MVVNGEGFSRDLLVEWLHSAPFAVFLTFSLDSVAVCEQCLKLQSFAFFYFLLAFVVAFDTGRNAAVSHLLFFDTRSVWTISVWLCCR